VAEEETQPRYSGVPTDTHFQAVEWGDGTFEHCGAYFGGSLNTAAKASF